MRVFGDGIMAQVLEMELKRLLNGGQNGDKW